MLRETDFLKGIILEDNPFEDEIPESVELFDLNGNEVARYEAK